MELHIHERAAGMETAPETGSEKPDKITYNRLTENLIEITFAFSELWLKHQILRDAGIDGIIWKQQFVEWANNFEDEHTETDWSEKDYLDEIEKYALNKILDYAGLNVINGA